MATFGGSNIGPVVMFGGVSGWNILGDTWEWNGSSWTPRMVAGPSPRSGHAMAGGPVGRVVLYGGFSGFSSFEVLGDLADAWSWDGAGWQHQPLTVPLKPGPRAGHAMAALH
jgi:hypothetical protein